MHKKHEEEDVLRFFCYIYCSLTEEGCWADGRVGTVGESLLEALSSADTVRKWKLDCCLRELHTVRASQVLRSDGTSANDLDGTGTSTVSTSHLIVKLGNSSGESNVSEFTVHIVSSRSGGITEPNSVILHDSGVLFDNLNTVKNFTRGNLHLTELMHVIPELGLGNHFVGGENNHAVCFWIGVFFGGSLAADHLILTHLSGNSHLQRSGYDEGENSDHSRNIDMIFIFCPVLQGHYWAQTPFVKNTQWLLQTPIPKPFLFYPIDPLRQH